MNIPQEKLNELADKAYRANSRLLSLEDALRAARVPFDVWTEAETARRLNNSVLTGLVCSGADDPHREALEEMRRERTSRGLHNPPVRETPLHLLSSPAARRYVNLIRAAAVACLEMEEERGVVDGLGEILSDYADIAELETFGPVGLRGLE